MTGLREVGPYPHSYLSFLSKPANPPMAHTHKVDLIPCWGRIKISSISHAEAMHHTLALYVCMTALVWPHRIVRSSLWTSVLFSVTRGWFDGLQLTACCWDNEHFLNWIYNLSFSSFIRCFFFSKSRVTTPKADREAVQVKIPRLRGAQVRGKAKLESRSFKGFRLKTPRDTQNVSFRRTREEGLLISPSVFQDQWCEY